MDNFAIVAPSGLATAQFVGLPLLCCAFAVFAHVRFARTTPVTLVKVVLLVVAGLQLRAFIHARHSEVRVTDERIELKVPSYYDRTIDLRDVDYKQIRIVDLHQNPDLQPAYRTDGIGLFGYRLGWHRLNNGRTAWVAITDPTRVVVIPEYEGPSVLVSVEDPNALTANVLSRIDTREPSEGAEGD